MDDIMIKIMVNPQGEITEVTLCDDFWGRGWIRITQIADPQLATVEGVLSGARHLPGVPIRGGLRSMLAAVRGELTKRHRPLLQNNPNLTGREPMIGGRSSTS